MKFLLYHATGGQEHIIELSTLEELVALVDKEKEDIIVKYYSSLKEPRELMVYDTFIE